jgi:hypothetical protein
MDTLANQVRYAQSMVPTAPEGGGIMDMLKNGLGSVGKFIDENPKTSAAAAGLGGYLLGQKKNAGVPEMQHYNGPLSRFHYNPSSYTPTIAQPPSNPYRAQYTSYAKGGIADLGGYSDGGITGGGNLDLHIPLDLGGGGGGYGGGGGNGGATYPFQNSGGFTGNNNAPQAQPQYNNPSQPQAGNQPFLGLGRFQNGMRSNTTFMDDFSPKGTNAFGGGSEQALSQLFGLLGGQQQQSTGGPNSQNHFASGGMTSLGGYSDGGQMLKGPGDGMSDSIPANIANKQPARLANEEFVIPADVVSHLGNGSSDAGAKQLYSMMDRVRKARTGTKKQGRQISPNKYMPA